MHEAHTSLARPSRSAATAAVLSTVWLTAIWLAAISLTTGWLTTGAAAQSLPRLLLRTETEAVVRAPTAALLLSGQEGGTLPVSLSTTFVPRPGLRGRAPAVAAVVELGGPDFLDALDQLPEDDSDGSVQLEVFVYVLSEDLQVLDRVTRRVPIDPTHRLGLRRGDLTILTTLRPGAGRHRLRVMVRAGEFYGLRGAALDVPATATALPPLFPADRSALLALALDPEAEADYPFVRDGRIFTPHASPALAGEEGESVTALLIFEKRWGGEALKQLLESAGRPRVEARLRSTRGAAERTLPATLGGPLTLAAGNLRAFPVELAGRDPEGGDLEAGFYDLSFALSADGGETVHTPPVRLRIGQPGDLPEDLQDENEDESAWTDTGGGPPEPALTAEASPPELLLAYRRVLAHLSRGQVPAARARLRRLEIAAEEGRSLVPLGRAQREVIDALHSGGGAAALLPVLVLHADLAAHYQRRGLALPTLHASQIVQRLAEKVADDPVLGVGAATALARVGIAALTGGSLARGEELLTQAVTQAPDHEAAVLLLAALHEKRGRFEDGERLLTGLLGRRPELVEARLRLAMSFARRGSPEEALEHLDSLVNPESRDSPELDWIPQIAFQETARLHMDQGRLDRAAPLLRRGLERWPGQPSLRLQQAYLFELEGRAKDARESAGESADNPPPTGPASDLSPRDRYNRWPRGPLRRALRELVEMAERRQSELGRHLGTVDPDSAESGDPGSEPSVSEPVRLIAPEADP